jgi:large subunit ribosomal protein L24
MAIAKLRVGDNVKVLAGRSKNAIGNIMKIDGDLIYIAGVNTVKKTIKKKQGEDNANHQGIKEIEAPVHRSNVVLFDKTTQKNIKVAIQEIDGKRVRVDRKTRLPLAQVKVDT